MDLAIPKFADSADRPTRPHRPWNVMTDSPASPAPVHLITPLRSPSPCLNLDALSSDESAGPGDISAAPICISDDPSTPVNLDRVLSDDDLDDGCGRGGPTAGYSDSGRSARGSGSGPVTE